ncbi:hypothetical protein [Microbulbifer spongiae]|uniref:Lipoprotein n=1 Tax=Microbulbifer spongiae TaxID=2944933 RepID=A0ABY9EC62_9GAMM|nr:hypothetical protein [Microbulbifer sp. MI-G]WKD49946.1 hypothetical protein M8T91_00510 [Microbulbifer sp. MI-G]
MKLMQRVLFLSLVAVTLGACTSYPLLNIQDRIVPSRIDGSSQTRDSVKQSIIAGCIVKGWSCQEVSPGQILASIDIRKHHAEANINYDNDSYSITYKDSKMLDYDGQRKTIHRSYNRWINNLNSAIIKEMSR